MITEYFLRGTIKEGGRTKVMVRTWHPIPHQFTYQLLWVQIP